MASSSGAASIADCKSDGTVAPDIAVMTASERRLVHEYLRDNGEVQTYSEGDEPDRHLVVAPLAG